MPDSVYKFGDFELDPARFELRRYGRALKLERIPMELLLLLVEKQGNVATRQEIVDRLWGKDVFLDTEHGINTAVRKIRQVLRDDSEQPRFIQTVTGKGYRFVADTSPLSPPQPETPVSPPEPPSPPPAVAPRPTRRWWPAVAALIVFSLAATLLAVNPRGVRALLFRSGQSSRIHSIAVLPLANLSGDASQDYYADGMTDEIITMLAKNTSLRVISRTSAMRYKGVNRPVADIARELGVDGILEGSISRSPNRVHMTVQLIHAPTDTHLWAESYDRDLNQAMLLPSELSQTIAREVNVAKSPSVPPRHIEPDAHDAYLRGRYFWLNGNDQRSQEYFEKAIQIQPDYAAAWAGLADSYTLRAVDGECPARDVSAPAGAAAHKAVELDPTLPEAHHALAAYHFFYDWDLSRAETEIRREFELNPNVAEGHHLLSYILFAMNRPDEAMQEQKRATELDSFERTWGLGHAYMQVRDFDSAIAELRLRAEAMPNEPLIHGLLVEAYRAKKMRKESEQELEAVYRLDQQPEKAAAAQKIFKQGGEIAVAQWRLDNLKVSAQKGYVSPLEFARAYAHAGDKANTLKFLEEAYRERHPWLILLQSESDFDFVHDDPRYQVMVKKIGLER